MSQVPASIRYNNPGAMWGGNAISRKWGETAHITLNDGLGQGNNIAFFPSKVSGAAAQFDLWRSRYCNMTLQAAVTKWSGGNSSPAYISFLEGKTGCKAETEITASLLAGPIGLALIKAQAQWEAGQPYPLGDEDWRRAQSLVFVGGAAAGPSVSRGAKKAVAVGTVATATASSAAKAAQSGAHPAYILMIVGAGIIVAALAWYLIHKKA